MKALLLMAMLSTPPYITPPKKLSPPPEHPIVKFLNKDIWRIRALANPCYVHEVTKVCLIPDRGNISGNGFSVTIFFSF